MVYKHYFLISTFVILFFIQIRMLVNFVMSSEISWYIFAQDLSRISFLYNLIMACMQVCMPKSSQIRMFMLGTSFIMSAIDTTVFTMLGLNYFLNVFPLKYIEKVYEYDVFTYLSIHMVPFLICLLAIRRVEIYEEAPFKDFLKIFYLVYFMASVFFFKSVEKNSWGFIHGFTVLELVIMAFILLKQIDIYYRVMISANRLSVNRLS